MVFDQNKDWFTHNIAELKNALTKLKEIKLIVEIGNFEGRSTIWFADHCPQAKIVSIDPSYNIATRKRLLKNISEHPRCNDIHLRFGLSEYELKGIAYNSANFVYVDGSHEAEDVLLDGLMSYKILKPGGIMSFDDYGLTESLGYTIKKPSIGIDAFLSVTDCEVIYKGWQLIIRKPL